MRTLMILLTGLFTLSSTYAADFTIKSSAFANNTKIPKLYTCDGKNISPPLNWDNAPGNTKSFVLMLICQAFLPNKAYAWVLYNIPYSITSLEEGANLDLPKNISVGMNYYYDTLYTGPCPPDHRSYNFQVSIYALDDALDISDGAEPDEVLTAMKGHILEQAEYTGTYSH